MQLQNTKGAYLPPKSSLVVLFRFRLQLQVDVFVFSPLNGFDCNEYDR